MLSSPRFSPSTFHICSPENDQFNSIDPPSSGDISITVLFVCFIRPRASPIDLYLAVKAMSVNRGGGGLNKQAGRPRFSTVIFTGIMNMRFWTRSFRYGYGRNIFHPLSPLPLLCRGINVTDPRFNEPEDSAPVSALQRLNLDDFIPINPPSRPDNLYPIVPNAFTPKDNLVLTRE